MKKTIVVRAYQKKTFSSWTLAKKFLDQYTDLQKPEIVKIGTGFAVYALEAKTIWDKN
jgi:hypothetical protein